MPDRDEQSEAVTVPPPGIRDAATVAPPRQDRDAFGDPGDAESRSPAAGFASLAEFSRDLVDIGLIEQAELDGFAADSAEGVLGLSRALIKAGKLNSYQAAAVYQHKSRGLLIGNYLILDKLGQGGMGMVFKARHRRLGRVGALKISPPSFARDRSAVLRFRREVEEAGRLKHPNVVAAIDADEDRGVHFLVMDYVEGKDLNRIVQERGPLPVEQAVDPVIQAARGLDAAHAEGIVHRDIKPGNLMLDQAGTVRVLDLGLARIADAGNPFNKTAARRLTERCMYICTIDFMAPEQAEDSHRVDHRADIYSLGCTLFYLLTGREPFPGETVLKRLMAHMERPAPSLRLARPEVSLDLEEVYQRMMAKRQKDRPASMTDLVSLLETAKQAPSPAASKPELKVFDEAVLKRAGAPRTKAEPSIFARPKEAEGLSLGSEISLEDLVMDVRSEVHPPPLPAAPRGAADKQPPLKRISKAQSRRRRTSPGLVILGVGAPLVLLAVVAGILFSRNGASPAPDVEANAAGTTNLPDPPDPPPATEPSSPLATAEASSPPSGNAIAGREPKRETSGPQVRETTPEARLETEKARLATKPTTRPVLVGTNEILRRLENRIALHFPQATPLIDVLSYIKTATRQSSNDPGIPIYVDPLGLQDVEKTMMTTVRIEVNGGALKETLTQIVGQLGLVYRVKDDVLIISSPRGLDAIMRKWVNVALDASSATKATLTKLEQPISMPFEQPTPLQDVIKFILTATKKSAGVPNLAIFVDPAALQKNDKSMLTTVILVLGLQGVPLKTSLRLLLAQLDFTYVVRDGSLIVTTSDVKGRPNVRRRN